RRSGCRRGARGSDPHLGRHRGRRRHHLGSRAGACREQQGLMTTWRPPTAMERLEIIRSTKSVAIVGMSENPSRASYFVATYLLSSSCTFEDIWFVNPKGGEVFGRPLYPSLGDLPAAPDLVDVFRRASDLPEVAKEFV